MLHLKRNFIGRRENDLKLNPVLIDNPDSLSSLSSVFYYHPPLLFIHSSWPWNAYPIIKRHATAGARCKKNKRPHRLSTGSRRPLPFRICRRIVPCVFSKTHSLYLSSKGNKCYLLYYTFFFFGAFEWNIINFICATNNSDYVFNGRRYRFYSSLNFIIRSFVHLAAG